MAAAAACKPWAAEAIEVHVCGGIDAFWLGHAEAAAQEAAAPETCRAGQLDASMPHTVWTAAAAILREAGAGVTPPVARALARRGAVWPLLRVGPYTTFRWLVHLWQHSNSPGQGRVPQQATRACTMSTSLIAS